jgi:hypothetical protein
MLLSQYAVPVAAAAATLVLLAALVWFEDRIPPQKYSGPELRIATAIGSQIFGRDCWISRIRRVLCKLNKGTLQVKHVEVKTTYTLRLPRPKKYTPVGRLKSTRPVILILPKQKTK